MVTKTYIRTTAKLSRAHLKGSTCEGAASLGKRQSPKGNLVLKVDGGGSTSSLPHCIFNTELKRERKIPGQTGKLTETIRGYQIFGTTRKVQGINCFIIHPPEFEIDKLQVDKN